MLSHDYPLTGWIPEKYVQMDLEDKVQISGVTTTLIYLYMVPAHVQGRWSAKVPGSVGKGPLTLNLKQQVTRVSGSGRLEGKEVVLEDLKLHGEQISFGLAGRKTTFTGRVKDGAIEGEVDSGGEKAPWSAKLGK